MGLAGNPLDQRASLESGSLLLRPWGERNKPFSLYSGIAGGGSVFAQAVCGKPAYQLQCTNEVQGDLAKVRMQFTEQAAEAGRTEDHGRVLCSG